jgi:hypothetical protein
MHISRPITGLLVASLIVVGTAPPAHASITAPVIGSDISIATGRITIPIVTSPSMDGDVVFATFQFEHPGFVWNPVIGSPNASASSIEIDPSYFANQQVEYIVKLRTVGNLVAGGAEVRSSGSNSISVRLQATPPTAVEVVPTTGDPTSLTVTYVAPTSLVASGVSGYEYSLNGGASWVDAGVDRSATSFDITGLGAAATSSVLVRARNSGYKGEASSPAVSVRHGVPEAPSGLRADSQIVDGALDVSWSRPASYAISALTGFEYSIDGGAWQGGIASAATSATITGLVDGRQTSVRIRARNASGASSASGVIELNVPVAEPPVAVPAPSAPSGGSSAGGSSPAPSPAPPASPVPIADPPEAVAEEIKSDIAEQMRAMAPDLMRAMSADELAELPADAFGVMNKAQMRALDPEQVTGLSAEQLAAITPLALRAMRPETLRRLKIAQLRALSSEQIRALRMKQVRALGPAKRRLVESVLAE